MVTCIRNTIDFRCARKFNGSDPATHTWEAQKRMVIQESSHYKIDSYSNRFYGGYRPVSLETLRSKNRRN